MSKVTRPILTGVYPRKRLFAQLDRLRKQPVIWISGPPGCGKTTLVSSYLEARKLPCLWYQVDAGDTDPATFFYYLGQAAKKTAPRKRKPLPLLTPEYLQGIPTFTLRYFENLYARLNPPSPPLIRGGKRTEFRKGGDKGESITHPTLKKGEKGASPAIPPFQKGGKGGFIIVFDNYQEIPTNSPFHEVILNGLSIIPEGVNVIIISRSDPPPALIRLRANHQMQILGWNDLRMTLEESEGIVRLRTPEKHPQETIFLLQAAADGWAAGLILMLESVKRKVFDPRAIGKLTPEEIFDYFGNELFDKTEKETQDFLLKTAFLPKMTAKMAEDLTGISHARRILNTLSRTHYFIEKRFHGESIYQYHPLFRDFLISRAKETFSPETRSILIRGTATLLEEGGQTEAAIVLLHDVSDWDMMIRLILKHAPLMIAQGRYHPLEDWLNHLPREILESNSWLLYWMGSCRLPFEPLLARSYFEKAFEKSRAEEEAAGLFLAWSGLVESIWFDLSDFKLLDKWITVLEELMHDFKEFPSQEIGDRVAFSMFIALVVRQPHHPDIEVWSERTFAYLQHQTNISFKILTLFRQALYRMHIGQYEKLVPTVNSFRQFARSQEASPLALVTIIFAETIYHRITGSHEKCLKAMSAGLELSSTTGIHVMDRMFFVHGTLSALSVQDGRMAQELLDKMDLSLSRSKPWDKCFYYLLRSREALLDGDLGRASLHAEMAMKLSNEVGSPITLALGHLISAHVRHSLGNHDEAKEHLSQALQLAKQTKAKNLQFYTLMAEALFALKEEDQVLGLKPLRKALALGREGKFLDPCIDLQSDMAKVWAKALEAGIEVEYVQELIRRRNLITEKPPLHLENWPWPLKVFTLGRFVILKDGQPFKFTRKVQQKPLSMLKALIAFGGEEVREDQISDALWPEADGDVAHESFATTLHRLRKLIGHEKAIQLREGRLSLDERLCWVDVWVFERLLGQAEARWREGLKDSAVQLGQKAMEIYKGPFLEREIEQPWAISMRERLRGKFMRNVGKLGQYWEQAGQWEKSVDCYQKGLEVDELAEEFYQGLMTCYQHLGRRAEALSIYNRCRRTLAQAFGIEPSAKTNSIYRSLNSEKQASGDKEIRK